VDNDGEVGDVSENQDERRRKLQRELEGVQREATSALAAAEGGPAAQGQLESSADALAVVENAYAITQRIEGALRMAVEAAYDAGHSWNEIGLVLDMDREEAEKRYGGS
jgi:hypothetical protein